MLSKYQPWYDVSPFLMRIIGYVVYVVPHSFAVAIVGIIITARNVNGIYETIFAKCVGKAPHSFFVACGDIVQPVGNPAYGTTFHFAMQMKSGRKLAIADEYKLTEITAAHLHGIILYILMAREANHIIAVCHCHISQSIVGGGMLLAICH